jgi:hypothetical protein
MPRSNGTWADTVGAINAIPRAASAAAFLKMDNAVIECKVTHNCQILQVRNALPIAAKAVLNST